MRAYVMTTGVLFGLLTLAHVARMVVESRAFASDPSYLLITAVTAALCVWAVQLLRRPGAS